MNKNFYGRLGLRRSNLKKLAAISALALMLSGCGGGGGDGGGDSGGGGIIGTGIQLRGTVPTNREFAQSFVNVRSASGERSMAAIGQTGRYSFDDVTGEGPYLLQVDLGNGDAYYSVAHASDAQSVTQNIHAYSDLAIRNWFANQGLDIEAVFESTASIVTLPTALEIDSIDEQILGLVEESLAVYELAGTDLSTVSFDSDDTGVDEFLDRNPVLINNGNITIIITDQDSNTQTTVSSDLPVDTDLTAPDAMPPSSPLGLRVLPSASNEIVLAWESATDNIGVTSYVVYRDGVEIATTAFPIYIDSPLEAGVTFPYTVSALDAAGNESLQSEAGSSQTLGAPDTLAPPSATDLLVTAPAGNTNSLVVRWSQSEIADVAAFQVLRGTSPTMLDQLAQVTSTALTDAGLNSGTQYCYQIITVDASENESNPSEIVCGTTSGTSLSSQEPEETNTPPVITAGGLLDVDVSNIACTTELETTSITEALVLDEPCYLVNQDVVVGQGGQVTIAAGTVLKFASGVGIEVQTGGSLASNGTAAAPVVFSAIDRTPGSWDGLEFDRSNSASNVLNSTVIEYGGSGTADYNLEIEGFSSSPARVSLNNVLLRFGATAGFSIDDEAIVGDIQGLVSTQNASSGEIGSEVAASLGLDSRLSGNTDDGLVILTGGAIDNITAWPAIDVPYLVGRLPVNAPMSIAAGSVLRFSAGGGLDINTGGSLSAIGTATSPILFTGLDNTPGFWDGLNFDRTNSSNNQLEHVIVEHAGGLGSNDAGVNVRGFVSAPARLAINNTQLRFNAGPGFIINTSVNLDEFNNVTVTANDFAGVIALGSVGSLGSNLDFSGNTRDQVELLNGPITSALTIPAINVPYLFGDIDVNAALTLSPGVAMRADSGAEFDVSESGSFNAVGTVTQPISIIGDIATPGYWDGIELDRTNSPLNRLEHVTLSHGGGGGVSAARGNITMTCFTSAPASLLVANSTLSDSLGWGVYQSSSNCTTSIADTALFSGNAEGAVSPQ